MFACDRCAGDVWRANGTSKAEPIAKLICQPQAPTHSVHRRTDFKPDTIAI